MAFEAQGCLHICSPTQQPHVEVESCNWHSFRVNRAKSLLSAAAVLNVMSCSNPGASLHVVTQRKECVGACYNCQRMGMRLCVGLLKDRLDWTRMAFPLPCVLCRLMLGLQFPARWIFKFLRWLPRGYKCVSMRATVGKLDFPFLETELLLLSKCFQCHIVKHFVSVRVEDGCLRSSFLMFLSLPEPCP